MSKYKIRLGKNVASIWNELIQKIKNSELSSNEKAFYKKLKKTLEILSENPKHSGLRTHEITVLTQKYGTKIWQSYLENNKSGAKRIFWIYGPNHGEITIVGIESHPSTSKSYKSIVLAF